MNHLLLLLVCIVSVEVFIQFKFLSILNSILKVTKKVIYIIPQDKISDTWKEKVVPAYALRIMKHSLQIFLIISLILCFFIAGDFFLNNFILFTLSLTGIIESIVFVFGYAKLRQLFIK